MQFIKNFEVTQRNMESVPITCAILPLKKIFNQNLTDAFFKYLESILSLYWYYAVLIFTSKLNYKFLIRLLSDFKIFYEQEFCQVLSRSRTSQDIAEVINKTFSNIMVRLIGEAVVQKCERFLKIVWNLRKKKQLK